MKAKLRNPKTEKDIFDKAAMLCSVAFGTVLRDKRGFTVEETKETIQDVNYLVDSINKDYVSFDDLVKELEKDGIRFI